jgi:hypothetical protein
LQWEVGIFFEKTRALDHVARRLSKCRDKRLSRCLTCFTVAAMDIAGNLDGDAVFVISVALSEARRRVLRPS